MPEISRFYDAERFYATNFHEAAHATEVPKRLNIDHGRKCFGNEAYSRGELYAEMTAAILGATLGFKPDHIEEHAGYIQSWLKALRNDKRFVLKAAADAQRGADYLLAAAGLRNEPSSRETAGAEDQCDEL
jgi:antirestriction protein ArdC